MPTQTPEKRAMHPKTLAALKQAQLDRQPLVHLWRGAPATRTWSRYQDTVTAWSVCGISLPENATENADATTCPYCLQLLGNPRRP
jgi:hypothetical protein